MLKVQKLVVGHADCGMNYSLIFCAVHVNVSMHRYGEALLAVAYQVAT